MCVPRGDTRHPVSQRPHAPRARPAPQEVDKQGNTPLHVAAKTGFKVVVQALLAGGAKSSNNRAGKSPAQVANDGDIAKLLESAAA
jgi:hypothetical protein